METPIYGCSNKQQHTLCYQCYEPLFKNGKKCPLCDKRLTKQRCLLLENMINKMPKIACKYAAKGCEFKRAHADPVKEHEVNDCPFRLIPCGLCHVSYFPMGRLPEHLTNQHKQHEISLGILSQEFNSYLRLKWRKAQRPIRVQNDKNLIFYENWRRLDDTCSLFWISYSGPKKKAGNFRYTLNVQRSSEDRCDYIFECTTDCVPSDISHQEMKNGKEGILLSQRVLEASAADDDDTVHYSLQIFKKGA